MWRFVDLSRSALGELSALPRVSNRNEGKACVFETKGRDSFARRKSARNQSITRRVSLSARRRMFLSATLIPIEDSI